MRFGNIWKNYTTTQSSCAPDDSGLLLPKPCVDKHLFKPQQNPWAKGSSETFHLAFHLFSRRPGYIHNYLHFVYLGFGPRPALGIIPGGFLGTLYGARMKPKVSCVPGKCPTPELPSELASCSVFRMFPSSTRLHASDENRRRDLGLSACSTGRRDMVSAWAGMGL